jgi:hypothetical protein
MISSMRKLNLLINASIAISVLVALDSCRNLFSSRELEKRGSLSGQPKHLTSASQEVCKDRSPESVSVMD